MKYLYKILRLFFCPHKYNKTLLTGNVINPVFDEYLGAQRDVIRSHFYDKECCYCGKIERFRSKI